MKKNTIRLALALLAFSGRVICSCGYVFCSSKNHVECHKCLLFVGNDSGSFGLTQVSDDDFKAVKNGLNTNLSSFRKDAVSLDLKGKFYMNAMKMATASSQMMRRFNSGSGGWVGCRERLESLNRKKEDVLALIANSSSNIDVVRDTVKRVIAIEDSNSSDIVEKTHTQITEFICVVA